MLTAELHAYEGAVSRRLRRWRHEDPSARLLDGDAALWSMHRPAELTDRLGWLSLPLRPASEIVALCTFGEEVRAEGFDRVVVLGMGGSSLAAEMFASTLPTAAGATLEVLDSTHPAVVEEAAGRLDPERTVFVVASKSGRTLETLSLYRYFAAWLADAGRDPGPQLVAVTDPGSELAEEAERAGFRRLWLADPEVGGRYSALTEFGLVPAAMAGVDIQPMIESARGAREMLEGSMEERIELLRLGAVLGELAIAGADKVTLLTGRRMLAFPAWLEQLIAESLGKRGRGIVPVAGEPLASAKSYDGDRLFVALEVVDERNAALAETLEELESLHPVVRIRLPARTDVGFELFRWEVAVATAATILGVNPFNQPDVEAAKRRAREALEEGLPEVEARDGLWIVDLGSDRVDDADLDAAMEMWLRGAVSGGYIGLQAYLAGSEALDAAVRELRAELGQVTRLATTFGYGPRFLHSTGQLHKGGPNDGLFMQLVDRPGHRVEIPDSDTDFGSIVRAQALGDAEALYDRRQWVLRVEVGDDSVAAVKRLSGWLAERRRNQ